jgi:hypothetical protein
LEEEVVQHTRILKVARNMHSHRLDNVSAKVVLVHKEERNV